MGNAARASKAVFVRPRPKAVRLPRGTKLPTQHLATLIDRFGTQKQQLSDLVFDGTTNGNVFEVNTVINPVQQNTAYKVPTALNGALSPVPVWDVRMTYAPSGQDKKNAAPEFTMTVRYRKDGIATRIIQDFGGVVLKGDVKQLEVYESPQGCAVETTQLPDIRLADGPNG